MSFKLPVRLAARGCAFAVFAAAALLAACGGGDQVDPFKPTRVLAFGDELSVIEADGRKYSINAFKQITATDGTVTDDPTTLDCARNPLWVQNVASSFSSSQRNTVSRAPAVSPRARKNASAPRAPTKFANDSLNTACPDP